MKEYKYTIIGTGPSGVSSSTLLNDYGTCIVDCQINSFEKFKYNSIEQALSNHDVSEILGVNYDYIQNLSKPLIDHPKFKSKFARSVMNGEEVTLKCNNYNFPNQLKTSLARGGLSNLWGSHLPRYSDNDFTLNNKWPISIDNLDTYFNLLEKEIGISGKKDDLFEFLGKSENLISPFKKNSLASYIYKKYKLKNNNNQNNIFGHPRLGLLSHDYYERKKFHQGNKDFINNHEDGFYHSGLTLRKILGQKKVDCLNGFMITDFEEKSDYVLVYLKHIISNESLIIKTKHLLLGLGTIQTTALILRKLKCFNKKINFIDHKPILLPIFFPGFFGRSSKHGFNLLQLVSKFVHNNENHFVQYYSLDGFIKSDYICDLPFSFDLNLKLIEIINTGLLISQIWSSEYKANAKIFIDNNNKINIKENNYFVDYKKYSTFIKSFLIYFGFSSLKFLRETPVGHGYHHVGTLPMKIRPVEFETHTDGRLWNSKRVRVIDGSVLPSLASKNHSLTMMANAMRITNFVL